MRSADSTRQGPGTAAGCRRRAIARAAAIAGLLLCSTCGLGQPPSPTDSPPDPAPPTIAATTGAVHTGQALPSGHGDTISGTAPSISSHKNLAQTSPLIGGLIEAFRLLFTLDPEVIGITTLSLEISGIATLISLVIGMGLSLVVALNSFWGKNVAISIINTGMGVPPVVVGLLVSVMLWRSGVFGSWGLLYTPTAMVIAQVLIATPIVTAISLAALQNLPPMLRLQIMALGASRCQMVWLLIREARLPILAAVMAGFGGIISEVGASMMVGGNIKGQTRVLTTATVLETSKGNFETAIAFGVILLLLAFIVNLILTRIQQRGRPK